MPQGPRRRPVAFLPSLATLANLACGIGALVYIQDAAATGVLKPLYIAAWLLVLAAIFDALDGKLARLTSQSSDLGAQLDSLADAITFGVVPALLARGLVIAQGPLLGIRMHPRLLMVAPILFAICAVLRLARFNVEQNNGTGDPDHRRFVGLPSPAAASLPIALTLFYFGVADRTFLLGFSEATVTVVRETILRILPFTLILTAALMVTRVPYPHFMAYLSGMRRSFTLMAEVVLLAGLMLVEPELALLLLALVFVSLPAILACVRWTRGRLSVADRPA
ncbi:MAG TPA: CDP-alcohol phosphatidyltransferase family protein [Planctomycetota bacterium]